MSKKYLAILLGAMVAACTVPEQEKSSESVPLLERMSFSARSEPGTKTILDGADVKWDENDRISVFDGYGNRCFTIESIRDDGSAVFSGEAVSGQPVYYACYPYSENNSLGEGNGIRTAFVSSQSAASPGSFGGGCNVSVAVSDNGNFAFKNIGGLLRFTLSRDNVVSISICANDGGTMGGSCEVFMDGDGNIGSLELLGGGETVTLIPESGECFSPGEYFLCVGARTYTGGVKLLLDTVEGEQIQAGTSSDVVVECSLKTNLGTIDTRADKAHRTLVFTPIDELNQSGDINSHAGWTSYSSLTPIAGTEVSLDQAVLGTGPYYQYPRFVKTAGGDVLLFYHPSGNGVSTAGNRSNYLRSANLIDWSFETNLFKPYSITDCEGESNTRVYAGAHAITLPDGNVLAVAATRTLRNFTEREGDNGLSIRISSDNGSNWGPEQLILLGTAWEPFPIVLPSGRIQIYYTDYNVSTGGTGTSYIYSDDNGTNWTGSGSGDHLRAFASVWYRNSEQTPVLTDQMPAVVCLNGTNALTGVAESKTGNASSFSYRLSLSYSDSDGSWGTPDPDGVLPSERNDRFIPGAAPYIIQFPSGETVISYNVPNSGFCYRTGDENARNFSDQICIFSDVNAFWGSMALLDSHRIIAGVGGNIGTLEMRQYYLNHAIFAKAASLTLDSRNADWTTHEDALWLCSGGDSKATLRTAVNEQYLYLLAEVEDASLSEADYIEITLSSLASASGDDLNIKANYRGLVESSAQVVVKAAFDGTSAQGDKDHGYLLEIGIPIDCLPDKSGRFMLGCNLYDSDNSGTCGLSVPLIYETAGNVIIAQGGNEQSGTGVAWTYEIDDYEW